MKIQLNHGRTIECARVYGAVFRGFYTNNDLVACSKLCSICRYSTKAHTHALANSYNYQICIDVKLLNGRHSSVIEYHPTHEIAMARLKELNYGNYIQ